MHQKAKIVHILFFFTFFGLLSTALAANLFFSKEAIMDALRVALPIINTDIVPPEQLFISRIIRREALDIHFYFGVFFTALMVVWFTCYMDNASIFNKLFFILGAMLISTGVGLFARVYFDIDELMIKVIRQVHFYVSIVFVALIVQHIAKKLIDIPNA